MGWLVCALIAAVIIGFYIHSDWRGGTGYFEPHGPRSSSAHRKRVEEGQVLCTQGLSQLYASRNDRFAAVTMSDAIATLSHSVELGSARATTGLGLAAYFSGDLPTSRTKWVDARYDDDLARLFLQVSDRHEWKTLDDAAAAFLRSVADPNAYTRRTATERLATHARAEGLTELAAGLTRKAEPKSYGG